LSGRLGKSEDRLQISLFTRLQTVEADLRAMKDLLTELKVNQDELRRDRDEWRWRAERLLADQGRGAFWRWRKRTDAALDFVTASLLKLIPGLRARLAEIMLSSYDPRQQANTGIGPAGQLTSERRKTQRH
jgi:hypothetical protein